MRILFHKVSNERHRLEIVRDGGVREAVECETRSYLQHDLLHYAVESEAGLVNGFWGNLHAGKTLAAMNDRTGRSLGAQGPELMQIEQVVGALSSVLKGRAPDELVAGLRDAAAGAGTPFPAWLTTGFVSNVQERMRQLTGRWKSTAFGSVMELPWPWL